MARISGVDLPKDKRIDIAISYLYGIGRKLGGDIITEAQIDPATRVKNLTEAEVNKISSIIQTREIKIEGDLRREIQANVRRLMDIGAYRGFRHRRNLPCRGQRTKTNARTRRGRRKTVGSARAEKPASAGAKPAAAAAGWLKKNYHLPSPLSPRPRKKAVPLRRDPPPAPPRARKSFGKMSRSPVPASSRLLTTRLCPLPMSRAR